MTILDKAKAAARRARVRAEYRVQQGRARMDQMQAQRQHSKLLQQLGETSYAEHRGEATHEAVVGRLAALDAQVAVGAGTQTPGRQETGRRARDIMRPGVECIAEDDSVATAAQKMRDLGVGSLPICGADDRLHGMITDRDIAVRCIAEGGDPARVLVKDLARGTPFRVDAAADVDEVLRRMEDHQVKRLPVIENHRLVGIITEADLARHLDEHQLAEFVERVYATS